MTASSSTRRNESPARAALAICILAGGLSSRMGRNKANIQLGGITLLQRVRKTARALGVPIRLIRRDIVPRCGPLGGIYTGLVTSSAAAELFLACDMPLIQPALLQQIIEQFQTSGRAVFARVAQTAGFPCIIPSNKTAAIEELINRKSFSIQKLASRLRAKFLDLEPPEAEQLMNINTPDQLQSARQRRAPQKSRERRL